MLNAGSTQNAGRRRAALSTRVLKLAFSTTVLAALPHAGQVLTANAAQEQPGAASFAALAAGSPLPSVGSGVPSGGAEPVPAAPRDGGQMERGSLGVSLQPLDEELAGVLGAPGGKGALVASVEPDSPAARGGLKQGDIVIGVSGKAVRKQRDIAEAVADAKPGSTVAVAVLRNGRRMEQQVMVGEPPAPAGQTAADGGQQGTPQGLLGLSLAARRDNEAGRAGVVVTGVAPGSAAEGRGLRAGDVILGVGDRAVATPEDVAGAVDAARNAGRPSVAVQVERGEGRASVALVLEAG